MAVSSSGNDVPTGNTLLPSSVLIRLKPENVRKGTGLYRGTFFYSCTFSPVLIGARSCSFPWHFNYHNWKSAGQLHAQLTRTSCMT